MSSFDSGWTEDERRLREHLQQLAQAWVPQDRDLWPAIRDRLPTSTQSPRPHLLRLRWALPLIALLTFGLTGLIHAPGLWSRLSLLGSFEESDQAQVLTLRETRGDITVALERIYADANVILIAYRIHVPPLHKGAPYRILLQDAEGRVLPHIGGEGVQGSSDILGFSLPPGEAVFVAAFDPWGLPDWPITQPTSLTLRLTIQWLPAILEQKLPRLPTGSDQPAPWRVPPPAESSNLSFVFTFQAHVLPGRLWEPSQTADVSGIPITLIRWVRAPSGARARICFPQRDPAREWSLMAQWTLRNHAIPGKEIPIPDHDWAATCADLLFLRPRRASDGSDPGSLQVLELIGWDREAPGAPPVRLPGPWIFSLPRP